MIIGINLLYLIHNEVGGTETYALNLLESLEKIIPKTTKVILFINSNTNKNLLPRSFQSIKLPFNANNRVIRYFFEQIILPFYIIAYKITLLHSFGYVGPVFSPSKHIVTIFDANLFRIPMSNFKRYFYGFFLKNVSKKCDWIITSSYFSKQEIVQFLKVNPEKVSVIYLGSQKDLSGKKWRGINENEKYIFALSNKSKHKNITSLIAAFNVINVKNLKLKIAGFVPDESNFSESSIEVLGYVDREKLISLYCNSLCFVMPSVYEGFGIPAVESMTLGIPTFLSNTTSLGEIGKNGAQLFDPENIESIASSIKNIIFDQQKLYDLSEKCLKRGLEFNWDMTAREVMNIYSNYR
jgi:glycosyltransferase involved in cell wall biosynthesis